MTFERGKEAQLCDKRYAIVGIFFDQQKKLTVAALAVRQG
jgi:hypothetical protein